jgi:hypothetical protein
MGGLGNAEKAVAAAATAPVTSAVAQRGKLELKKMQSSLVGWLKFRKLNDRVVAGQPVPKPLFKRPGDKPLPPGIMMQTLRAQRSIDEQALATQLHQLLGEIFDPNALPNPDVARNPNAAVQLAEIAISGKLPGDAIRPGEVGAIWMWPLVIVVGVIGFVIMTSIRSSADVAKERERIECIKAGACTDSGFFLKLGAVAVIAWLVWDKLGVGERVKGALVKR